MLVYPRNVTFEINDECLPGIYRETDFVGVVQYKQIGCEKKLGFYSTIKS